MEPLTQPSGPEKRKALVVLGDLLLDEYIACRALFSKNEQVPVLHIQQKHSAPGNAANVARTAAALGARTILSGVVGQDPEGDRLLGAISPLCDVRGVLRLTDRPTSLKSRLQSDGAALYRVDREHNAPITAEQAADLLTALRHALSEAGCCVLSDLGKGVYPPSVIRGYIDMANERRIPVVADPAGSGPDTYRGVAVIAPNVAEFNGLTGSRFDTGRAALPAAQRFLRDYGIGHMLLKAGAEGSYWIGGERVLFMPALCRAVVSSVGAGDSFVSAFASSLLADGSSERAFVAANVAAAVSVSKPFTPTVTPEEAASFAALLPGGADAYLSRL